MLFNSFGFLFVFLPVVVLLYWLIPRGYARLLFLIVASCVFYGLWDWRYIPLLLGTTLIDWVAGWLIVHNKAGRRRKLLLAAAITVNLALLAYFKYRGFFFDSMDGLFSLLGMGEPLPMLRVLLPVGISFYTFAAISYVIDVYRGMIPPAKSVVHYLAWATLFPYLMAGPIIRYGHVGEQLERAQQRFRWSLIGTGVFFLVMGLAKKILVADIMATYVNELFAQHAQLGLLSGWGAALGYTLQLYFDFSGYSDMAVGVAFMIGLRFPQNFDSPYKAVNPSDFWRRWHMSLSSWLRDYLFIPLGGSRGTTFMTVRNLLITFLLAGLWHGPAWTFVFWGLLWGVFQAVHVVARKKGLHAAVGVAEPHADVSGRRAGVGVLPRHVDARGVRRARRHVRLQGRERRRDPAAGTGARGAHRRRAGVGQLPAQHLARSSRSPSCATRWCSGCCSGPRCWP